MKKKTQRIDYTALSEDLITANKNTKKTTYYFTKVLNIGTALISKMRKNNFDRITTTTLNRVAEEIDENYTLINNKNLKK